MQDRNILDVSCVVACYISLMHYIFLPLYFSMYTQRLRDPYIKALKHYFFRLMLLLLLLQSTKKFVPLLFLSACIIFLYIHIYVILLAYTEDMLYVCVMCFVYMYMHSQMPTSNSVSFKPIYNQSERKALSFLIRTGCYFS